MASTRRPRRLAEEELFEYAVKTLGARAYSAGDLKSRLLRRAVNAADPDKIVARLKDIGYLDDRKFAESYANARVENQGFGKIRVLTDLRGHRIAPELASKAVDQAIGDKTEVELIEAFMERRMASIAREIIDDDRKLAAAYRKLRRAGFSSGGALNALKKRAKQPELLDEPPPEDEDTSE